MHLVVGLLGLLLVGLVLVEFFLVYLLPRRVRRDPQFARQLNVVVWNMCRAAVRRLPPKTADTVLGFFGPVAVLTTLSGWVAGLILGFAAMDWATGARVGAARASFGDDLYYSAGALFSVTTNVSPAGGLARVLRVAEAAAAYGVIFVVIGYLPALYQAFSRRETKVSLLDPRAGSPPSAGALVVDCGQHGSWADVDAYLEKWEEWTGDLMESHLSYPVLTHFRSQHVNQSWLGALTVIMDAAALALAAAPAGSAENAEMTYRMGRHALSDLTFTLRVKPVAPGQERLTPDKLGELLGELDRVNLPYEDPDAIAGRLAELRATYEPYAQALGEYLVLDLPEWLAPEPAANWKGGYWRRYHREPRV
jgi:hypothetical protein